MLTQDVRRGRNWTRNRPSGGHYCVRICKPTANLSANPTSITPGQSSILSWLSTNATSCAGSGGPPNFSTGGKTSGSLNVSPQVTTPYSVTCTGSGGTASASATVSVIQILSFTATVLNKDKARLDWHVETTGLSCSISISGGGRDFDNLSPVGSVEVWRGCPAGNYDYEYTLILQCGTYHDSRKITVPRSCPGGGGPPPTSATYCFKVVDPIGICGTFQYQAASQPDAKQAAQSQSPPGSNVTSIDCSQMSTACSQ